MRVISLPDTAPSNVPSVPTNSVGVHVSFAASQLVGVSYVVFEHDPPVYTAK